MPEPDEAEWSRHSQSSSANLSAVVTVEDDRRLSFEARRFALETLVKIYLENYSGSRALVVSQTRVMLTLAIAAVAGFVTIFAAMLRPGREFGWVHPIPITCALFGLGLLVASALWSTRGLSSVSQATTNLLRDPFPGASKELEEMFGASNEDIILDRLVSTIQIHIAETKPRSNFGLYATVCLILGIGFAAISLAMPLLIRLSK